MNNTEIEEKLKDAKALLSRIDAEIEDILNEFGEDVLYFEEAEFFIKKWLIDGEKPNAEIFFNCYKNRDIVNEEHVEHKSKFFKRSAQLVNATKEFFDAVRSI